MNKQEDIWVSNLNCLHDFIMKYARFPRSSEKVLNEKTGTLLLNWYQSQVYQYRKGTLPKNRVSCLKNTLGDNWYRGSRYLNKSIFENISLHQLYPNLRDKGNNLSVITLYEKGIVSKKEALTLLSKGIYHLYDMPDSMFCSIGDLKKCFDLPEYGYCWLYLNTCYISSLISFVKRDSFNDLSDFVDMYKETGIKLLEKRNLLEVIKLKIFDRLSYKETAEKLGISVTTVKAKISIVITLLVKEFERYKYYKYNNSLVNLPILDISDLSVHTRNSLRRNGFVYLQDLKPFYSNANSAEDIKTELTVYKVRSKPRNIGEGAIREISDFLWNLKRAKRI